MPDFPAFIHSFSPPPNLVDHPAEAPSCSSRSLSVTLPRAFVCNLMIFAITLVVVGVSPHEEQASHLASPALYLPLALALCSAMLQLAFRWELTVLKWTVPMLAAILYLLDCLFARGRSINSGDPGDIKGYLILIALTALPWSAGIMLGRIASARAALKCESRF